MPRNGRWDLIRRLKVKQISDFCPSYLNKSQTHDFKKLWYILYRENLAQIFALLSLRKILPRILISPA